MQRKMHALRTLSYVPDSENNWTLCQRHVADRNQIAAFDSGVTCKKCLAVIEFRKQCERDWAAYKARGLA